MDVDVVVHCVVKIVKRNCPCHAGEFAVARCLWVLKIMVCSFRDILLIVNWSTISLLFLFLFKVADILVHSDNYANPLLNIHIFFTVYR